jgi:hypothetical protein
MQKFPIIMRNLEKCPECLQRFHVEWQGKSSQKGIYLILNRLIRDKSVSDDINKKLPCTVTKIQLNTYLKY